MSTSFSDSEFNSCVNGAVMAEDRGHHSVPKNAEEEEEADKGAKKKKTVT